MILVPDGLLQCGVSSDALLARHHGFAVAGDVDIGTGGKRLAPIAHGTAAIEFLSGPERSDRLGVVEAEDQHQSLIKVALRFWIISADYVVVMAHPLKQWRTGTGNQLALWSRGQVA